MCLATRGRAPSRASRSSCTEEAARCCILDVAPEPVWPFDEYVNHVIEARSVTFMFTDIEGSTRRWEADRSAMQEAMRMHDEILKRTIETVEGWIFRNVGDGVCATFPSPGAAVRASFQIQLALAQQDWAPFDPLKVRIALHTSRAIRHGHDDDMSPELILCARLLSTAHGGQVLLSEATALQVRADLTEGSTVKDLGLHRLKDLSRFEHVFQLVHPDLQSDFPPLLSLNVSHNLPSRLTSLIGREEDVRVVRDLIRKHRVLTIAGAGGIGKTRLALKIAADALDRFRDGVWFVALGALRDPALVTQAVASALGVRDESSRAPEDAAALAEVLQTKNLLLVLDNCEHLLDECSGLVETLTSRCPHVVVFATSQQPLGIAGEKIWTLQPMPVPSEGVTAVRDIERYEAVQLFLQRARDIDPTFSLDDARAVEVAKVCRALDGLPLAIELAAARINALTVEGIAAGLEDRFRLLSRARRSGPERQRTLLGAVQWSYELLDEPEQALFARLSVFMDGAPLEAIEAVASDDDTASLGLVELLAGLVDRSLVMFDTTVGGSPRYRMLETLRHFGAEQLRSRSEAREVESRHATYYLSLAEAAALELRGVHQLSWLERLKHEQGNFRAALANTLAHRPEVAVRVAGRLWWLWWRGGLWSEGSHWLEKVLATNAGTADDKLRAICGAALLAALENRYAAAESLVHEGTELATRIEDQSSLAWLATVLGEVAYYKRDLDAVEHACGEALSSFEQLDDSWGMAWALRLRGQAMGSRGRFEEAARLHERGLQLFRSVGDSWGMSWELYFLGAIARSTGDHEGARSYYEEALRFFRDSDEQAGIAHVLQELAELTRIEGDFTSAGELFGESLILLEAVGDKHCSAASLTGIGIVAHHQGNQEQALARLTDSIRLCRRLQHPVGAAWAVQALAKVLAARGDAQEAALLLGAVHSLRQSADAPLSGADEKDLEDQIHAIRSSVGATRFQAQWSKGRALDLQAVADVALEAADVGVMASCTRSGLVTRPPGSS